MDLEGLLQSIEHAHGEAVRRRDEAYAAGADAEPAALVGFSVRASAHGAVALALGDILGKATPPPPAD